jgi:RHS repeat-associated protein
MTIYRIDDYAGTPAWVDISPAGDYLPISPYGLAVDRGDASNLMVVARSGLVTERFASNNKGAAWTKRGETKAKGARQRSGKTHLFGSKGIDYAPNPSLVTRSKNGNWASVFNGVGTIRAILDPEDEALIEPPHDGPPDCDLNHASADDATTSAPISLRSGEKFEAVTDMSLNTPAGALSFTRQYRQERLGDAQYQFMGLGWTHNHAVNLTENTGMTPNTILVRKGGTEVHFSKTAPNFYSGDRGSNATIVVDPLSDYNAGTGAARYTLTGTDTSIYRFDASGKLRRRRWPNGEYWEYTYVSGKLSEVIDDAYTVSGGLKRKLTFSYYGSGTQQLQRVTDQTGRYVEFTYVADKINSGGSIINGTKSVLSTVLDPRGNTWSYTYYGQGGGETDVNLLNFLTQSLSPSVDTTGDGTPDGSITLKSLSYTQSGGVITNITQQQGLQGAAPALLATTLNFQPSGRNVTEEIVAGKSTTHHFDGGVYIGAEDANLNYPLRSVTPFYRPSIQADANGNETFLEWSDTGKLLMKVTDALQQPTVFSYNTTGPTADTLKDTTDAQGRKTEYTYGDANQPRLPTRIKVLDTNGTTVLRWQELTYDAKGRVLTDKILDPANGVTVQQQVTRTYGTSGDNNGLLESQTQVDPLDAGNNRTTTYTYDSFGRVIKTQQSSLFGSCQFSYTVYDAAGNVLATVCSRVSLTQPTNLAAALALYDPNDPDKVRITTYGYDEMGRRVKTTAHDGTGSLLKQTTLTFYDALSRVVRTISNYVNQSGGASESPGLWVWQATRARWEKSSSNAAPIAFGATNDQNVIADTAYNARGLVRLQRDALGNVTLFGYDDAGRLVKSVRSASQPTYNNDDVGALADVSLKNYIANSAADQDIVTLQEYDAAGNPVKTTDPLGNVTLTGYDALNRPVKTIRSASQPGYNFRADPTLTRYNLSAAPDRDGVETSEYDALGRVIRTRRLLDNRPGAQWDTTLFGYDSLGRQTKVIRSASQPTYNLSLDPGLSRYTVSAKADQDIVTQTVYDAAGRALYTEDTLGRRTWSAYDGLGRPIKTVVNPVGAATDNGVKDPRSLFYNTTLNLPDRDILTRTAYDSDGRVLWTEDSLGRRTWPVYDSRGRTIRTMVNAIGTAVDGSARDPRSTNYIRSADSDKDVITRTVYDGQGRVSATFDARNNQTRYFYDLLGRQIKIITHWVDGVYSAGLPDEDRITTTTYDLAGRVVKTVDPAGIVTRYEYDRLGRRTRTIVNYVDGVFNANAPDEDLISLTVYNKVGQVVSTTDARGTQTAFAYDRMGRQLTVTQAANTPLAATRYTCYDKAGRVLRTIQNWTNDLAQPAPDAQDGAGAWLFIPAHNGGYNDRDLITSYSYDRAGRRTTTSDPLGNTSMTSYFKDGQVDTTTDPEGTVTAFRYDRLRRQTRVVQGYVANGEDPANWVWDAVDIRWEKRDGTAVAHGTNNDQNIIVDVAYDKAGRQISLRNPNGNVTAYTYDLLDRRTSLTNPISKVWKTAYTNRERGQTRLTTTYPGITGASDYQVQRDFDRLGRLASIAYGDPATTPDVKFAYDTAGNRTKMSEYTGAGFTNRNREATYSYDDVRRLTSVGFDNDGNGSVDETVSYEYDAGGLRTKLTLPGSLNITYLYDARGQLISLTDWDSQQSQFAYDLAGRHVATDRANGLRSTYQHDAAGRLRVLRHVKGFKTFGHYAYKVDRRGNRIEALEMLAHRTATTDTTLAYNDKGLSLSGSWSDVSSFKESTQIRASLALIFLGDEATLSMGQGPDHAIYDVYLNGTLWQSFDGYAASPGQSDILISLGMDSRKLQGEGPHILEIRNRAEKNKNSSGYKIRFKQLVVVDQTWTAHILEYAYDQLARVREARYNPGLNTAAADADLLRRYQFTYDRVGNRLSQSLAVSGGAPTVTNYTYNAANQITNSGFTYDNNGNLTSDSTNTHTWDRANRLLNMGGAAYKYDALGNRIRQTVGSIVTNYLLDLQSALPTLLIERSNQSFDYNTKYIHGPRGVDAHFDNVGNWTWMLQDGLGSVRSVIGETFLLQHVQHFAPYGEVFNKISSQFANEEPYSFTGEWMDDNGLLYLRARYYNPALGTFLSLDPFEGTPDRPMSLNGYSYVGGNPVNRVDRTGRQEVCLVGSEWVICPPDFDGVNLPPGLGLQDIRDIGSEAELLLLLQSQQQPTPAPPIIIQQQVDCRRRENQNREECQEYWDRQNPPKQCRCSTNYHPNSFQPFASEDDMLCNLDCYNGDIPYLFYRIGLRALGTGFQLIPSANRPIAGAYFEGNEHPDVALATLGVFGINTAYPGGTIVVRQPSIIGRIRNRATQMATLVEEIGHAAIWNGFFSPPLPPCRDITKYQNEATAKIFKWAWMGLAAVDVPEILFLGLDEMEDYGDQPAFHRCGEQTLVGCCDPQILAHLPNIMNM